MVEREEISQLEEPRPLHNNVTQLLGYQSGDFPTFASKEFAMPQSVLTSSSTDISGREKTRLRRSRGACFTASHTAFGSSAAPPPFVLLSPPLSYASTQTGSSRAQPRSNAVIMATSGKADEPDRTLFVGNLESRVQEEILYELFLQAGPVTKVTICKDKDGKPKTFGFVCFKHTESVPYAIALLNGIRLYGRPIKVQYRFGSSHFVELSSHCQNVEHDVQLLTHSNLDPYGGTPLPPSSFQVNSSPHQGYSAFQNMMTYFLTQQYTPYNSMGQQFPYQMASPPPFPSFAMPPYLNPGQTSFECVYPEPKNYIQYLVKEGTPKRKRPQETSDSDSSMESDRKKAKGK
ncbi:splicing regulator RBM11 isoform X2 [Rhineura floridana]|uniref:splicing regulator RBM11 isoform X2 n=1 Tax=Rhineura floridana TaxID=261503 RepID=UPI002AC8430D|nr:splicing regulator RBM11 isoform X2 [Rhineura floridana]